MSAKAKVIKTTYDVLNEKYTEIELGQAKSNFANTLNKVNSGFKVMSDFIRNQPSLTEKAIAHATERITGGLGGYVVINQNGETGYPEEILIMDKPDKATAVNVWRFNKGGLGHSHNGYNGNLLVLIEEVPHKDLVRDENDLVYNLLLTVPQAALGGAIEIPTLDGAVKLKIEPGTQPGKMLRLRGKGLPELNTNRRGDMIVNVSVYIPETLSRDEKQALEKLQTSDHFQPTQSIKEKLFRKFRSYFD